MRDDSDRGDTGPASQEAGWLTPSIQRSHERSETYGLSISMHPDYDVLSTADLALKREQSRILCVHAAPVMETLREQIANTQSMIVLTDAEGLILHSIGDDDFLMRAEKVALRPGANWAETRQGTNAIGTAIAECRPTVVHGDQHYLAANRFLTCSSVPIFDPYGELSGVLDVTGDHHSYHQHTMALAKMSVQLIENHLFATTFRTTLQISFHERPEFLGTLMEGIAAFTSDGRFLSANRSAQFQLGLTLAGLRAHTLSSLFGLSSSELIDQSRDSQGRHLSLTLRNGQRVRANVEFRQPAPTHADGCVAEPRTTSGILRPVGEMHEVRSRLSHLETGDPQVSAVIAKVRKIIGKDIPLLVTGETGTGKELLAQAIHNDSPRHAAPFVAVNCASIPESLIESELFGYEEGAFTGAKRKGALGRILQANGGTLFLDEIGDMPYPLQVRLLRVLQERVVDPLGSAKSIPVDIAIICATHRDLREMISLGRFREDLYYRLNGLVVKLPPLRDRTDLPHVIESMLREESLNRPSGPPLSVSEEVMALFERCRWPGNFRQLGNLMRTAAAMVDEDGEIRIEHLPDDFLEDVQATVAATAASSGLTPPSSARLQDVAAHAITAAVAQHGGNVSAAARALGVSRNTIYRKRLSSPDAGNDDGNA
ncbi:sigma-54-dependent Fis family transcriptional regulator [Paraburkholderia oxyphila]|uniref:sigma-54-dependent Fis family transcriptional regulator n=1 Tax=Paraburkholderia oxyphila TaxID=614212 RepID=UPI0004815AB2|nr:sigma-54-dependent Fis family transcriptional regulator [Paraburkholderia oxyphila]